MSSILSSQSVVLATAMAAVSGTVLLLAFRHQKFAQTPRPCLASDGKRRKKNKRVHFAEDVVEPSGDGVEFRKRHRRVVPAAQSNSNLNSGHSEEEEEEEEEEDDDDDDDARKAVRGNNNRSGTKITGMPANRLALYNGMLRDRVGHRLAYSC